MEVSKKLKKIKVLYDPSIPFLDIYLEKNILQKATCNSMFMAAICKSQDVEAI